jgi:hypothetical protein
MSDTPTLTPQPLALVIEEYPIKLGENIISMPAEGRVLSVQPRGAGMAIQVQQPAEGLPVPRTFWLEHELDHVSCFNVKGKRFELFEDKVK